MSFMVKNIIFDTLSECFAQLENVEPHSPSYYRIRDNYIEKIEYYSKKISTEITQKALEEKPIIHNKNCRLEAAGIVDKWCSIFGLQKPQWMNDSEFQNTWRTPVLGQFITVSGIQDMFQQVYEKKDFYYDHAMLNSPNDYSVV